MINDQDLVRQIIKRNIKHTERQTERKKAVLMIGNKNDRKTCRITEKHSE